MKAFYALDAWIVLSILVLVGISLAILYSLSFSDQPPLVFFKKQAWWFLLGFCVFLLLAKIDFRIWQERNLVLALYAVVLLLLILTLLFGKGAAGIPSWLKILGFNIQSSELAKIVSILALANYFSQRRREVTRIVVSFLIVSPLVLLVFLQPDYGAVVFLGLLWLAIVFVNGLTKKEFVFIVLAAILLGAILFLFFAKPYQRERVYTFLNPSRDPLGAGYAAIQAKIAVGSAGFWGRGTEGIQGRLKFLPESKTDFFFAAFIEQWGFAGFLVMMAAFTTIFVRLLRISRKSSNAFGRNVVEGLLLNLILGFFFNAGMNVGILPVIGLPMPLLSYGGSNLMLSFISLGISQSVKIHSEERY